MKLFFTGILLIGVISAVSQVVTTSPAFPRADQPLTITVNVTGTSLDQFAWNNTTNPVWIWTWIAEGCTSSCDAPTNVNPATSPAQDAAKATRISTNPDVYQITFTPTLFFNKPLAELNKIGLKLKSTNWSENKQTDNDRFITFNNVNNFLVSFTQPASFPQVKNQGEQISITGVASEASSLTLKINDVVVANDESNTAISYDHIITDETGVNTVVLEANNGSDTKSASFTFIVRTPTINEPRPPGIIDGINYHDDPTKVTLSLWAPDKQNVYVMGDFTDWTALTPLYQMKKDGEHFWMEISGLTAGTEYGFQYLVDEWLRIADPYADKILDPNDQYIPVAAYPNLKPYPNEALTDKSYFNVVSVLQTNQQPYQWQITNFQKPSKEKLVIYELLIRDFFGPGQPNYQNLIDTLSYFKRLGINAIELMPIMEFNGNESWGYNPTFMFAPDKYYGTKNKLKEFIDKCHQNGIAVILDITMNHQDTPNPYVIMDFDFTPGVYKPTANNKWFNVEATHPFNVFFDLNHESPYTQAYLDTVNYYWLNEFKVDGFRFDLSKGFTQTNSGSDVDAWSNYDASRVALLKRMADAIWSHTPDAYIILEHLGVNQEEKELAEYRSNEGKGMILWGIMNYAYNQNSMGFAGESDISWVYHGTRGWSTPGVVGYMESHDEERLMYKNLQFGAVSGSYNVKNVTTALERMKGTSLLFYTIPGPKMLWQFGESGYSYSINRCENGTINPPGPEGGDGDCRLAIKPPGWDYTSQTSRVSLFDFNADLLALRNQYDVFTNGTVTFSGMNTLVKQLIIKNQPYVAAPQSTSEMNVVVTVNLDLTSKNIPVAFPHTGKWYDYYSNGAVVNVSSSTYSVALAAGGYKLYTDVSLDAITANEPDLIKELSIYPNPTSGLFLVESDANRVDLKAVTTANGQKIRVNQISDRVWDATNLRPGLYFLEFTVDGTFVYKKIIKF
jgi:glycosidase